jgi:hypothetical protein
MIKLLPRYNTNLDKAITGGNKMEKQEKEHLLNKREKWSINREYFYGGH